MTILLDECVPWPIHKHLVGHDITTAQKRGWSAVKNGDLLKLAELEYQLFLTADQNLRYQQTLSGRRIAILVLSTNELRRLQSSAALILAAIHSIQPGQFVQLAIP